MSTFSVKCTFMKSVQKGIPNTTTKNTINKMIKCKFHTNTKGNEGTHSLFVMQEVIDNFLVFCL